MSRQLTELKTDSDVEIISRTKKKDTFKVLFYSEWDKDSAVILERAREWVTEEGEEKIYLISSWKTPHAFAMFMITSAPSLVHIDKGRIRVQSEYPSVYDFFSSKTRSSSRKGLAS
jgi:hypothetical protein